MASLAQYESALRNAHLAGDEDAARSIAQAYQQELSTRASTDYQMKPDAAQGNPLTGALENAASIGSRALLTIPAGLAGVGRSIYGKFNGETPEQADVAGGQMVRNVLSKGYDPKTVQGQAIQAGLVEPFKEGGDAALKYGGPAGKFAFDVGSQLLPVGKVLGKPAARVASEAADTAALLKHVDSSVGLPEQIDQSAKSLITNLGGYDSKTQYDRVLKKQNQDSIDAIKQQEAPLYDQVKNSVGNTLTAPKGVYQYITNRLAEVGGNPKALSAGERTLMTTLENNPNFVSVNGQPQAAVTYGALDSLRRQFGKKYSNDPEFATTDTNQRDAIYSALSSDQMNAAQQAGVDSVLTQAHGLTRQRKGIEDAHYALFDKDASGSSVPKVEAAAKGLQAGDLSKYEDFVSNTPDRRQGAIQVLQALMRPGDSAIGPKFIDALSGMDPYARMKFISDLPPAALAKAQVIGEAAATPMPKSGNILGEAYRQVKSRTLPAVAAEAIGSMAGFPGAATTAITGAALKKAHDVRRDAMLATARAKLAAKK